MGKEKDELKDLNSYVKCHKNDLNDSMGALKEMPIFRSYRAKFAGNQM